MIRIRNVEVWWEWYYLLRPSKWQWGREYSCHNGCTIFNIGWWGFTILRNECGGWK